MNCCSLCPFLKPTVSEKKICKASKSGRKVITKINTELLIINDKYKIHSSCPMRAEWRVQLMYPQESCYTHLILWWRIMRVVCQCGAERGLEHSVLPSLPRLELKPTHTVCLPQSRGPLHQMVHWRHFKSYILKRLAFKTFLASPGSLASD